MLLARQLLRRRWDLVTAVRLGFVGRLAAVAAAATVAMVLVYNITIVLSAACVFCMLFSGSSVWRVVPRNNEIVVDLELAKRQEQQKPPRCARTNKPM